MIFPGAEVQIIFLPLFFSVGFVLDMKDLAATAATVATAAAAGSHPEILGLGEDIFDDFYEKIKRF